MGPSENYLHEQIKISEVKDSRKIGVMFISNCSGKLLVFLTAYGVHREENTNLFPHSIKTTLTYIVISQNYLNILASFSIFSNRVISLYSSMISSSRFSFALCTRDLSLTKEDVNSLK